MEFIVFCGIPASGKTTFQEKFFPNHQIISKDRISKSRRDEKQDRLINFALTNHRDVVIDNNNTEREQRTHLIDLVRNGFGADATKVAMKLYYFGADIEGSLQRSRERNLTRTKRKQVPDFVVRGFLNHLDVPNVEEGFDEIYHVSISKTPGNFDIKRIK